MGGRPPQAARSSFRGGSVNKVRKYYISNYISYQRGETSWNCLNVCDSVKGILRHFPISEAKQMLRDRPGS